MNDLVAPEADEPLILLNKAVVIFGKAEAERRLLAGEFGKVYSVGTRRYILRANLLKFLSSTTQPPSDNPMTADSS